MAKQEFQTESEVNGVIRCFDKLPLVIAVKQKLKNGNWIINVTPLKVFNQENP